MGLTKPRFYGIIIRSYSIPESLIYTSLLVISGLKKTVKNSDSSRPWWPELQFNCGGYAMSIITEVLRFLAFARSKPRNTDFVTVGEYDNLLVFQTIRYDRVNGQPHYWFLRPQV